MIDWDSRDVQTVDIPGARWMVRDRSQDRFSAAVRREAKRRGLRVTVTIAGGCNSAHVRVLGERR